jgi:poly-gamma-glutamate capsule biosynthesis protein CapA/YwtB (metallophosphatase superfamily)/putative cell wall-binding protein
MRGTRLPPLLVAAALAAGLLAGPAAPADAARDATPARLAGGDRIATAAAIARTTFRARPETATALLARADAFPDALAAASLAGATNAPVLLVGHASVPADTEATLAALGIDRVVVLGGGAAVSPEVEADLAQRYDVVRLAGPDRYGTAAAVARAVAAEAGIGTHDGASLVLVASGETFADALAAGPLAFAGRHPILLTRRDGLPPATTALLDDLRPQHAIVLGGSVAVSETVVADLRARGVAVERVSGPDRTATAARVADLLTTRFGFAPDAALLARGDGFPDALAAGPRAGTVRAPILLTPSPGHLGDSARAWLGDRCGRLRTLQAVGGGAAIAGHVLDEALRVTRVCAGVDAAVRFGFAAVADPVTGVGQDAFAGVVSATLADVRGWTEPGVLGFDAVPSSPHLVVELRTGAAIAAAAPGCSGDEHCRVGDRLLVHAERWRAPPAPWQADPDGYRRYVVNHLVGRWLGGAEADCAGAGQAAPVLQRQVGDLGGCAPSAWPTASERRAAHDRYVPRITVAAAGDVHGEAVVRQHLLAGGNPLHAVAPVLSAADVAIVNLETAVGTTGRPEPKTYTFQAPPQLVDALAAGGVDVVNLANNHALDYGVGAMFETINHARRAGLHVVGAGADAAEAYAPAVLEVRGRRVAVIGLTRVLHTQAWAAGPSRPGLASAYDEAAAVAAVRRAREVADHVVVAVHWGVELAECPDAHQLRLARLLVDAGAEVIAGHHPHVLQGIQTTTAASGTPGHDPPLARNAVVAYSLGNFVWYHRREPSRYTGVLTATLQGGGASHTFAPAEIDGLGSPIPVGGALGQRILADVARRSPGGGRCGF